jgi:hypothetical protein
MPQKPNLREIAPALDGSRHNAAWQLAQEIGVAFMHIVVDGTERMLGTVAVEPAPGPLAHLVVREGLSPYSGGFVYTPVTMHISHAGTPETFCQVVLG